MRGQQTAATAATALTQREKNTNMYNAVELMSRNTWLSTGWRTSSDRMDRWTKGGRQPVVGGRLLGGSSEARTARGRCSRASCTVCR